MTNWISLDEVRPEPEVFVLAWDGERVSVDWWGSLIRPQGTAYTHWMPFPTPPGVVGPHSMYGMHSLPRRKPHR